MKAMFFLTIFLMSGTVFAKNGKNYPMRESITEYVFATGENACRDSQAKAAELLLDMAVKHCALKGKVVNDDRPSNVTSIGHGYGIEISHAYHNMYCGPGRTDLKSTIRFDCVRR